MADEYNKREDISEIRDGEEYWSEKTYLTTLEQEVTNRGFGLWKFKDRNGAECSLQDSSSDGEACIWLGIKDANPQIMASKTKEGGTGWVPFDIPDDVLLTTRMHLTQEQVKALLPILTYFAETGEYVRDYKEPENE